MNKKAYEQPRSETLSLETTRETLQATSSGASAGGENLGTPDIISGDWTDLFN